MHSFMDFANGATGDDRSRSTVTSLTRLHRRILTCQIPSISAGAYLSSSLDCPASEPPGRRRRRGFRCRRRGSWRTCGSRRAWWSSPDAGRPSRATSRSTLPPSRRERIGSRRPAWLRSRRASPHDELLPGPESAPTRSGARHRRFVARSPGPGTNLAIVRRASWLEVDGSVAVACNG